eukprot:2157318-Pyramimonas_sp.AAC.1
MAPPTKLPHCTDISRSTVRPAASAASRTSAAQAPPTSSTRAGGDTAAGVEGCELPSSAKAAPRATPAL